MNTVTANIEGTESRRRAILSELVDERGSFLEIDKNDISIDDEYQREEKQSKIIQISRSWSWVACGAIIIAVRDGRYYAIDGQHRVLAARKINDIKTLPCLVFRSRGIRSEAKGFLDANTNRKPLTSLDKFKAYIVCKDPDAMHVEDLIRQGNLVLNGNIHCVAAMMRLSKEKQESLDCVWPLICEISKGYFIHKPMLMAIVTIEHKMRVRGLGSLMEPMRKNKLLEKGFIGIKQSIEKSSSAHEFSGLSNWVLGVLNILNKGLRTNRLNVGVTQDEDSE